MIMKSDGMSSERPSKVRDWMKDHVDHQGDGCLIWPFAKHKTQGYGHYNWWENGKCQGRHAHTQMCILAHGPAPEGKPEAAHTCGNGKLGCVNPRHLEWKSRSENQKDRRRHGTAATTRLGMGHSALTNNQWDEIRALKGKQTLALTAQQFGSTVSTVHRIQNSTGYARGDSQSPKARKRREMKMLQQQQAR